MNVLLVSTSPHREKSRTFALAMDVAKGMGKDSRVDVVHLCDFKMEFCRACEVCHKTVLRCPLKDDTHTLLEKMLSADGIILATPNYINQVAAPMKALFDRASHFIHCKRLLGKYVCGVVTSGSGQDQTVLDYLCHYAHTCGAQYSGGVSAGVPMIGQKAAETFRLGETFARDIREKKEYPDQTEIIEKGRGHFKKIMQIRKEDWSGEYEYWQEKGWL